MGSAMGSFFTHVIAILMASLTYSCQHYPQELPEAMHCHQLAYYDVTKTIYLFGGSNETGCLHNVYKWDISDTKSWFQPITQTPTCFSPCVNNVVTINKFAYFIGIDDTEIYIFDMLLETWVTNMNVPVPNYPTTNGCLSTNDTHIFIAGGTSTEIQQNSGYSNYLQILDINSKTWISEEINLSPINRGFAWSYCALVEDTNSLYIMGGYDPIQHRTDDIYKYDILTHEWTYIGDKSVRSDAGIAVYSAQYETIFVVGGWNGTQYSSNNVSVYDTIDMFDINSEVVQDKIRMIDRAFGATAIIIDDMLYIFGGASKYNLLTHKPTVLSTVQVCDLSSFVVDNTVPTEEVILEIIIANNNGNVSVDDVINIVINSYPLIVEYEYKLITTDLGGGSVRLEITITVPIHGETINTNEIKNQLNGLYGDETVDVSIIDPYDSILSTQQSNDRHNNETNDVKEYVIYIIAGSIFVFVTVIIIGVSYYMLHRKRKEQTDINTDQIELNNVTIGNNDEPTYHPMISLSNSPIVSNDEEKISTEGNNTETAPEPKVSFVVEAETEGNIDSHVDNDEFVVHEVKTKGNIDVNPNIADDEFIVDDEDDEQINITKY